MNDVKDVHRGQVDRERGAKPKRKNTLRGELAKPLTPNPNPDPIKFLYFVLQFSIFQAFNHHPALLHLDAQFLSGRKGCGAAWCHPWCGDWP